MAKKRPTAVPSEFVVSHSSGTNQFSKFISKINVRIDAVEVPPGRFGACPICLSPDPQEKEHLPPESLGGRVMTWTCQPCNNDFGTAEEEMRRFLELEVRLRAEAATEGRVRGSRGATVALRSTPDRPLGAFVKTAAPDFNELLASGPSQLRVQPLDMDLVRAAALKQAYLAACLLLRAVPSTDAVGGARTVLLAARDRDAPALTQALREFPVETPGWIESEVVSEVLLIEPSDAMPRWMFAFAGRFTMPWPFPDLQLVVEAEGASNDGT